MDTKIKTASVKVMLSYDYCHFEAAMSLENDNGLEMKEVNEARKNCQRLADKAVSQYKTAKDNAAKRQSAIYEIKEFKNRAEIIAKKEPQDRTIAEIALLKQYQDEAWQSQFEYEYDYEDD